jgi:hypothetical protein
LKIRKAATVVIAATMFVFFFYGIVRFPDGPIHPCGTNRYCGKWGRPHTLQQYRAFEIWETTLIYMLPVGIISLALLNKDKVRKQPFGK